MSVLKWQVNSSSNLASFFIVKTHNSYVNFKLIHFLFWLRGSHQSPNFETFECSAENFPNSSCHFPNHKISSFSMLLLTLDIFMLHKRNKSKCKFLRLSSARVKIQQIPVISETANQFFFKFCITLQCHETYLLCAFLAEIWYTFNKRSLSKNKVDKISRGQLRVWYFALWWAPFVQIK